MLTRRNCASTDISPNYGGKFRRRRRHVRNRDRLSRERAPRSSNTARYVSLPSYISSPKTRFKLSRDSPSTASPRLPAIPRGRWDRKNALFHSVFLRFSYSFSSLRRHNLRSRVTNRSRNRVARLPNVHSRRKSVGIFRLLKYFRYY